jgi:hypothetical protein
MNVAPWAYAGTMERTTEDTEDLLRRSCPRPRAEFVRELEAALLRSVEPRAAPMRRWPSPGHRRRLVTASGFGAALAALLVALSIAGALPLSVGGADDAAADRDCVTTTRWTLDRQAVLRVGRDHKMHLSYRTALVPRRVVRCH